MTELRDETLSRAYEALAKMDLPQDEMNALFGRLMASPEALKQELREEVIAEIAEEYEVGADEFPCEFYTDSDESVTLGMGANQRTLRIRYLNIDDFTRLSAYIPDVIRYLYKKGPNMLKSGNVDFQSLLKDVLSVGVSDLKGGKPSKFMIKLYEELAKCLSNHATGQVISGGYLRSCLPNQVIQAVRKLVEVNQRFFTDLWQEVPGSIRLFLDSNFGKIIAIIKTFSKKISESVKAPDSAGGMPNGGMTNGLTPSQVSTTSRKRRSVDSTLSLPTVTKSPSNADATSPDTLIGDPQRQPKSMAVMTTSAAASAS